MESLLHSSGNDGYTMIHCAAQYGHSEVVRLVLDEYNLDPTARDKVCTRSIGVPLSDL